jgi:sulfhydrogenase subunit beta (sulfur reductase)
MRSRSNAAAGVLPPRALDRLIGLLREDGYRVIGPTLRDGVILYDEISGSADLPVGWSDEQRPATYRTIRREDAALFGFAVGPQAWKRFLFPPHQRLWKAERRDGTIAVEPEVTLPGRFAFLGVRACDLHAIAIQDRVFLRDDLTDTVYATNRRDLVVVAVDCGSPSGSCFCAAMGTGPEVPEGADLTLSELLGEGGHRLLIRAGTDVGVSLLTRLEPEPASAADEEERARLLADATAAMGRSMDTRGIRELLARNLEHPRWDEVATRCLTCANCTLVCPTCFCSDIEDVSDLDGDHTERWRRWDSCFGLSFSHVGHGSVRTSARSRYRQWLTHKLGTWIDQFGTSGCVGCGRCITWCPVGIDITEEVAAIRATDGAVAGSAPVEVTK